MKALKLWIARDKFDGLYLHAEEPQRVEEHGYFRSINAMKLPILEYPEIRWANSPQQVELISSEEYKRLKECEEICRIESDYGDKHYC